MPTGIGQLTGRQNALRLELDDVEEQMGYLKQEIAQPGADQSRMRMGMISEMEMFEADQQSLTLQIDAYRMDPEALHLRLDRVYRQADALLK